MVCTVHTCKVLKMRIDKRKTHGLSGTKEYNAWLKIKGRCYNPKNMDYPRYGGVGITLFEGWFKDPAAFCNYVGLAPSAKHSIDRWPNHAGNYAPGNVRWADTFMQNRNKKSNINVTIDGQTKVLKEWCRTLAVQYLTVYCRIRRGTHTPTEALLDRTDNSVRIVTHEGVSHSIKEWSAITGIKYATLRRRIGTYGWSVERALSK